MVGLYYENFIPFFGNPSSILKHIIMKFPSSTRISFILYYVNELLKIRLYREMERFTCFKLQWVEILITNCTYSLSNPPVLMFNVYVFVEWLYYLLYGKQNKLTKSVHGTEAAGRNKTEWSKENGTTCVV